MNEWVSEWMNESSNSPYNWRLHWRLTEGGFQIRGMNTVLTRLRVRDGGVGQADFRLHSWFAVQLLCRVQLFSTPWTAARQASLSFTTSQKLLKLMSIESVIPVCLPLNIQVPLTESCLKFTLRAFLMGKCFQVLHVYPFFAFVRQLDFKWLRCIRLL